MHFLFFTVCLFVQALASPLDLAVDVTDPSTTRGLPTTTRPPYLCPIDDPMPPPDDSCPPSEEFPSYLPYPYDCTKYFQCSNGNAVCMQCPTSTVWDQEQSVCVRGQCVTITTTAGPPPTTASVDAE